MTGTDPKSFFSDEDKQRVEKAISQAELQTSGELRVHVECRCGGFPYERGKRVFENLGMVNTELRNGVLIYLAIVDKRFAILGDSGINEKVPDGFWDDVRDLMQTKFQEGAIGEGIEQAVLRIGEKLAEFFPRSEDDVDELDNAISFG